jgi:uncharacterized membrane protein
MAWKLRKKFRNYVLAGTITLVPLTVTVFILHFIFQKMDGFLMPYVIRMLRMAGLNVPPDAHIWGVGVLATVALIFIVGLLTTNLFGRKIVALGEGTLVRIPLVSSIYFSSKQLVEAFSRQGKRTFHQVVMVEYPRRGIHSLGLMTKDTAHRYREGQDPMLTVFMPTTPNPTSGILILVPREDIYTLPMTVEEGIKFVISGGIILPRSINLDADDSPGVSGEAT